MPLDEQPKGLAIAPARTEHLCRIALLHSLD
jgi:hypothetical protein